MSKKKTLVLGASENPSRYSNLAINRLLSYGHPVVAIGRKHSFVKNLEINTEKINWTGVDTVTLYLNPSHQPEFYDYILSLNPKRIIFNPGTENDDLVALAKEKGIQTIEACTLVLLSTNQY